MKEGDKVYWITDGLIMPATLVAHDVMVKIAVEVRSGREAEQWVLSSDIASTELEAVERAVNRYEARLSTLQRKLTELE